MPAKKKPQTKKMVRVSASAKETIASRIDAGAVIAANAPTSAILTANGDVKTAQANLVAVNTKLSSQGASVNALELELATEKGALADLTVGWDGAYDVYVSTSRLYCLTDQDAKGLGLPAAGVTAHALAMPLLVTAKWDVVHALLRIHVRRPAGLRSVRIEISPDPITATSWKALDGDGATAALSGYAPGTYWIHAAMVKAREMSAFSSPVSVIVK